MEFDNNTPVSDEQRRLAESKQITLHPVHTDIQPEGPSGSEIVARHLNEPAIANIENDTEQNKEPLQPSDGLLGQPEADKRASGFTIAIVAAAALSVLLIGTFLFFK
jgi:hypothetical protein